MWHGLTWNAGSKEDLGPVCICVGKWQADCFGPTSQKVWLVGLFCSLLKTLTLSIFFRLVLDLFLDFLWQGFPYSLKVPNWTRDIYCSEVCNFVFQDCVGWSSIGMYWDNFDLDARASGLLPTQSFVLVIIQRSAPFPLSQYSHCTFLSYELWWGPAEHSYSRISYITTSVKYLRDPTSPRG